MSAGAIIGILILIVFFVVISGIILSHNDKILYPIVFNGPQLCHPAMLKNPCREFPLPCTNYLDRPDTNKAKLITYKDLKAMNIMVTLDTEECRDNPGTVVYLCLERPSIEGVKDYIGRQDYPFVIVDERKSKAPYLCMGMHILQDIANYQMVTAFEDLIPAIMSQKSVRKMKGLKCYPGDEDVINRYRIAYRNYIEHNNIDGVLYNPVVYYAYDDRMTGNLRLMVDNLESFPWYAKYTFTQKQKKD